MCGYSGQDYAHTLFMRESIKDVLQWWPLGVVVFLILSIGISVKQTKENIYEYSEPDDIFQIVRKYDDFNYSFRHIHSNILGEIRVKTIHAKFCDNYNPPFSAGETLIWLRYYDRGACWDVKDKEYGYKFLVDDFGHVVLTQNCKNGTTQVICDPPNIGIFLEEENKWIKVNQ